MWSEIREKGKFVEGIVSEILYGSQLRHELKYKLKGMGEGEIRSRIYTILNRKKMNSPAMYTRKLKNEIKLEFLKTLDKGY